MKTIIVSDVHVGSKGACEREFKAFLLEISFDRLIIAGDFFDLWEVPANELRKSATEWRILFRYLRLKGVQVDYILGNHDENYLDKPVIPIFELPVSRTIELKTPKRRIAVIHGHEFDRVMNWYYPFYRIGSRLRRWFGRKHKEHDSFSNMRHSKHFVKMSDKMRELARTHYARLGFDCVIMGHTHVPEHAEAGRQIEYVNAGDWKGSNTYVEIIDGKIQLKQYQRDES